MFEGTGGMDTSYGGFMATQDTAEKKGNIRGGRGSAWIPVFTKEVHALLPGQDAIRRGTTESQEVTIVGIVRSCERKLNAACIDYYVDDHTGPPLLVNQMIENEREDMIVPVAEKTYVRVIGKVRTWGSQRGITAFTVIPLKSLNELTMHNLEVVHCKLFYQKDILGRHLDIAQGRVSNTGAAGSMNTSGYAGGGGATSKMVSNPGNSGLTGVNGEIHKFLSTSTTDSGYALGDIQRRFPQLALQRIKDQLELLSSEGHVYTTIDDEHYRTTDS